MGNSSLNILLVEDDGFTRALVGDALRGMNHEVVDVDSVSSAMYALAHTDFHVVVTDLNLGHGPSGADLLARISEDQPWMGMVALTSHSSPELAIGPHATLPPATVYKVIYTVSGAPNWASKIGYAARS